MVRLPISRRRTAAVQRLDLSVIASGLIGSQCTPIRIRLDAPPEDPFIIGDRGVTWLTGGFADTPPSALRHDTAQVIAPLSRTVVLAGRHASKAGPLSVTPREVNRFIACTTSRWIAGPTNAVVETALADRAKLVSGENKVQSTFSINT